MTRLGIETSLPDHLRTIYSLGQWPGFWIYDDHHHHVVPLAWVSLTLSRHFSLSFIASGRSSGLHPTKTIQVRRTRHAGHCWRSWDELISDVLLWTHTHGRAKAGRPARTYIQQLCEDTGCCQKTCQMRWIIGKSGERGSGISVLPARHDDDDEITITPR